MDYVARPDRNPPLGLASTLLMVDKYEKSDLTRLRLIVCFQKWGMISAIRAALGTHHSENLDARLHHEYRNKFLER